MFIVPEVKYVYPEIVAINETLNIIGYNFAPGRGKVIGDEVDPKLPVVKVFRRFALDEDNLLALDWQWGMSRCKARILQHYHLYGARRFRKTIPDYHCCWSLI